MGDIGHLFHELRAWELNNSPELRLLHRKKFTDLEDDANSQEGGNHTYMDWQEQQRQEAERQQRERERLQAEERGRQIADEQRRQMREWEERNLIEQNKRRF